MNHMTDIDKVEKLLDQIEELEDQLSKEVSHRDLAIRDLKAQVAQLTTELDGKDDNAERHGYERAMADSIRSQVIEFHKAFIPEQGIGEGPPHVPADDVVRHRLRLIFEEAFELLEAALDPRAATWMEATRFFANARKEVASLINGSSVKVDLPEFVDALADIDYVVEGTRLCLGVNGPPVAAEVHASNMTKVGGHRSPTGKWIKPDTYRPANIAGELKKQGWKP